jgi:hypothetical protein
VHVAINAINTPTYFLFPRMAVAMGLATFGHKVVRASRTLAGLAGLAGLAPHPRRASLRSRLAWLAPLACIAHVMYTLPFRWHAKLMRCCCCWLLAAGPRSSG